jgi:hypothetical protein
MLHGVQTKKPLIKLNTILPIINSIEISFSFL